MKKHMSVLVSYPRANFSYDEIKALGSSLTDFHTKGFNGFRKISKSFEGSRMGVTANNDPIKERILNKNDPKEYRNSLTFPSIRKLSIINSE